MAGRTDAAGEELSWVAPSASSAEPPLLSSFPSPLTTGAPSEPPESSPPLSEPPSPPNETLAERVVSSSKRTPDGRLWSR